MFDYGRFDEVLRGFRLCSEGIQALLPFPIFGVQTWGQFCSVRGKHMFWSVSELHEEAECQRIVLEVNMFWSVSELYEEAECQTIVLEVNMFIFMCACSFSRLAHFPFSFFAHMLFADLFFCCLCLLHLSSQVLVHSDLNPWPCVPSLCCSCSLLSNAIVVCANVAVVVLCLNMRAHHECERLLLTGVLSCIIVACHRQWLQMLN